MKDGDDRDDGTELILLFMASWLYFVDSDACLQQRDATRWSEMRPRHL